MLKTLILYMYYQKRESKSQNPYPTKVIRSMSKRYILRKAFISSQDIPDFANRSFYCYASNDTSVDTAIFLQPKTAFYQNSPKQISLPKQKPIKNILISTVNQLPIGHRVCGDELHPPRKADQVCKLCQTRPNY